MTRVGWIGTGAMGRPMASRLLDAGHDLVVWNRTPAKASALVERGARLATSPADAAREADVVVLMLADPTALAAVTGGADGLAGSVRPGTVVIEMSTVGPQAFNAFRDALPAEVRVVDAPVLGSIGEAAAGTLKILVGGSADDVAAVHPLLAHLGEPVHVGPSGSGAAAKLVANSALLGVTSLLGEAIATADRLGLSRAATWEVLARTVLAAQVERRRTAVDSGAYPPRFALRTARKDAALIAAANPDARIAAATRDWFEEAEADGWGDHDYAAVLAHILGERPPQ
jgi:3-hydroxyisobutyrate dehydrogenase-like beta-hydroxyacid dehydrogenase